VKTQGAGREGVQWVLKEVYGLESTEGEITEERPLLLELDLISRQNK